MAAVTNVTTYGGGLTICPSALPDDGILDVCIVHDCSRLQLMMLFPTILFKQHTKLPFVKMFKGKQVSVQSSLPRLALGDGEHIASTPLTATADPGALRVMTSQTMSS
ncbi:Diacylglycerol kinase [compost metagenome]